MGKDNNHKTMNTTSKHQTNNNYYTEQKLSNNTIRSTHRLTNNKQKIERYNATTIHSVNKTSNELNYDSTPNMQDQRQQIHDSERNTTMQEQIRSNQESDNEDSSSYQSNSEDENEEQTKFFRKTSIHKNEFDTPCNPAISSRSEITNTERNNLQQDADIVIDTAARERVYGKRYASLTKEEVNQLTTYTRNVFSADANL